MKLSSLPWKSWDVSSLSWAQPWKWRLRLHSGAEWAAYLVPSCFSSPLQSTRLTTVLTFPLLLSTSLYTSDVGYCLERPSTLSFQVTTPLFTMYFCLSDTGTDSSLCVLAHVRRRGFYFSRPTAFYLLPYDVSLFKVCVLSCVLPYLANETICSASICLMWVRVKTRCSQNILSLKHLPSYLWITQGKQFASGMG